MGLLNDVKAEAKNEVKAEAVDKKAAKKEKKEAKREALKTLIAFAQAKGDEKVKAAAELLTAKREGHFGGEDLFTRLFGASPKVGDTVKAYDMFDRINKNLAQMRKLCDKWAEKGNVVKYDADKKIYTIIELA